MWKKKSTTSLYTSSILHCNISQSESRYNYFTVCYIFFPSNVFGVRTVHTSFRAQIKINCFWQAPSLFKQFVYLSEAKQNNPNGNGCRPTHAKALIIVSIDFELIFASTVLSPTIVCLLLLLFPCATNKSWQ